MKQHLLATLMLSILLSCAPPTIEEQVEHLMQADDYADRERIAIALADSLSPYAADLVMGLTSQARAQGAIETMLNRYSMLMNEPAKLDKACTCIRKIVGPDSGDKEYGNYYRVKLIVNGLKNSKADKSFHYCLEALALEHGDLAMNAIIEGWKSDKSSEALLSALQTFDQSAVHYLAENLAQDPEFEDLLARMGDRAAPILIDKMKDDDQTVRFAAADALVKMSAYHPAAVKELTSAIDNGSTNAIARNYPFYIRMGLAGTEDLLLKALDQYFTEEMCTDYANCGNAKIEEGAGDIAGKHGYFIFTTIGDHSGPKWGSGN